MIDIDWTLFVQLLNFLVLVFLLNMVLFRPIRKIILSRKARLASFEEDIAFEGLDGPVHAVFIRAPWVAEHGEEVQVLARVDDHPVAVRQGNLIAVSFHPELAGETRLHELLLRMNGHS